MNSSSKIGIIGGGSWATALAKIVMDTQTSINWYVRNKETRKAIAENGRNPRYLGSVTFDSSRIFMCDNINQVIESSDILIFAVPAVFVKTWLEGLEVSFNQKVIISALKGLIPDEYLTLTEYVHQKYDIPTENLAVVSGPSHAEEISLERLSFLTVASHDKNMSANLARIFESRYVHTVLSDDIHGIEYAGILKNIYAVASGICHGLGYGDNFNAVLVANCFDEMKNFLDEVYPQVRDVQQSAYLGDLLVTAYSQFSRNRVFGNMIGKGYSVKFAQLEMQQIAEGYYAAKGIHSIINRKGIRMPIVEAVYNIIYENITPVVEMKLLAKQFK